MRSLWTYLSEKGHEIIWLGQHHETIAKPAKGEGLIEECDVIYLYWRWRMNESYIERNKAFDNQMELIQLAGKADVPLLVTDGDHKMTLDDITYIQSNAWAVLTAPELAPRKQFRQLFYPNPYELRNPMVNRMPFFSDTELIYIGNNYERWDQWVEFIAKPSNLGMKTKCFGNWLEPHPDRQTKDEVKKAAPKISFPGRLAQTAIIDQYLTADTTVHLAKPSYCETGFVTMRWAEAAAAGTFAFIPREFKHLPENIDHVCGVDDGQQLYEYYTTMDEKVWFNGVMLMQEWVRQNMTLSAWLEMLKEACSAH